MPGRCYIRFETPEDAAKGEPTSGGLLSWLRRAMNQVPSRLLPTCHTVASLPLRPHAPDVVHPPHSPSHPPPCWLQASLCLMGAPWTTT